MTQRYFRSRWLALPLILSAVFAVLFFPVVREKYDAVLSVVFTVIGVVVIWAAYVIRAHVFSQFGKHPKNPDRQ